jgi:hypothetical protein
MADEPIVPSPAQVPPAAAPETQQPEKTAVPPAVVPPVVPPAEPEVKKPAAAEPVPASVEKKPEGAPTVLKKEDLKLPEGSLLDAKAVDEIVSLANEKKLSKESAQAILERESKAVVSYVEGEKGKATQMQEQWYEAAKTDKEIGGEAYEPNVELGHRVLKRFGTEALEHILKTSGTYEHPEVLRFIVRIGKAMAPDQLVIAGAGASGDAKLPRLADRLYGPKPEPAAV